MARALLAAVLFSCWLHFLGAQGQLACRVTQDYLNITSGVGEYVNYTGRCSKMHTWCKVKPSQQLEGDMRLVMAQQSQFQQLKDQHIPFGIGAVSDKTACWLVQDGYATLYSPSKKVPILTAERLEGKLMNKGAPLQPNACFRRDPRLKQSDSAPCAANTGVFREQLVPPGDIISFSVGQMNTYMFTNVVPQENRRIIVDMERLEQYTRKKALSEQTLYVLTGVSTSGRVRRGSFVPQEQYKLLVWCDRNNNIAAEYFVIGNSTIVQNSTDMGMTVGQIQDIIRQRSGVLYKIDDLQCREQKGLMRHVAKLQQAIASRPSNMPLLNNTSQQTACDIIENLFISLNRQGKVNLCPFEVSSVLDLDFSYFTGCRSSAQSTEQNDNDNYSKKKDLWKELKAFAENIATSDAVTDNGSEPTLLSAQLKKGQTFTLFEVLQRPRGIDLSSINYKLQSLAYDCKSKQLDVHTTAYNNVTILPSVLAITNAVVSLRISLANDTYGSIETGISGEFRLGNMQLKILARYNSVTKSFVLTGSPGRQLAINLQNLINGLTGTFVPIPLSSVTLNSISVTGELQLMKGGLLTVDVSGFIGESRVHAIFQKPASSEGKFSGAFAADISSFKLSTLLKKAAEVDISSVPLFGSLTIPRLGLTVSSNYITSSLLPTAFCRDDLLKQLGVTIPKGLSAFIEFKIGQVIVPMKLHYFQSKLSFEVIKDKNLTIGYLLTALKVNIRGIPLPPGVGEIFKLRVEDLFFDTTTKGLELDSKFPGSLRYFSRKLTISDMTLRLKGYLKNRVRLHFNIDGAIAIGSNTYQISIKRHKFLKKYVIRGTFEDVRLHDIIQKFSAKVFPKFIQKPLTEFTRFSIHSLKLHFPLRTRRLQVHLSGTPKISGYKSILRASIVRQRGRSHMILGLQFERVSFVNLLQKLTNIDLNKITLLNQELDTSILISTVTLSGVHLHGRKLRSIPIAKGLTIQADMGWPSSCSKDVFCAVAMRLIGNDTKLHLQGIYTRANKFLLTAKVPNLKLGSSLALRQGVLQVRSVGTEQTIVIEGSIHLTNIKATLDTSIRLGSRGVVLQSNMAGCVKKIFGLKFLTICKLKLLIELQPTSPVAGALELGGEVKIGVPSCTRKPITASGYLNYDEVNLQNNFFYAQVKESFCFRSLLQAFCFNFPSTSIFGKISFSKGFIVSYATVRRTVPKLRTTISQGFQLKGRVKALGVMGHADVNVRPKITRILFNMSPLRLAGGILKIYASSKDSSKGPYIKASITSHPRQRVYVSASAFVSVLGIRSETMLKIKDNLFEFIISGEPLGLFKARLHISTFEMDNINNGTFRVQGSFQSNFLTLIANKINSALQKSSNAANHAVKNAKNAVSSKKRIFDIALSKLRKAQNTVNRAQSTLNHVAANLEHWKSKVRRLCSIRRCYKICIGCFGKNRCWKRFWGKCILRKRKWNKCCRTITDPICYGKNALCRGLRRAAYKGLRLAQRAFQRSGGIFNAARGVLNGAKRVFQNAKHFLDLSNVALDRVNKVFQVGIKALKAITKYGLRRVFSVNSVSFDASLRKASTGHFRVSVTATVLGRQKRLSISINLKNIIAFVRALSEAVIHGLRKFVV